jgi:hypothetical protein
MKPRRVLRDQSLPKWNVELVLSSTKARYSIGKQENGHAKTGPIQSNSSDGIPILCFRGQKFTAGHFPSV